MKRIAHFLLATLLTAATAQAGATCYTVYGQGNRIVYQAYEPPVDMRYPLQDTVPVRFGRGASMVFALRNDFCDPVGTLPSSTGPTSVYPPSIYREPIVNADTLRASPAATTPTVSAPIRRAQAMGGLAR